ncbi:MAG: hypothetical protein R6W73_01010 [Candidatus Saliniplasma sp.]
MFTKAEVKKLNRGKLYKKEEFSKIMTYARWMIIASSFVLAALALFLFDKRLIRIGMAIGAVMQFFGGIFIGTLQRSDLEIYEKGIKIPKAKLDIWNNSWGLPEEDFIPFEDISKIYAKTEYSLSDPKQGVFLEMNDGREFVLMWGSKDKLKRISNEIKEVMDK